MRRAALLLILLDSCARPPHPNPYVPPETQYSTGSTLMAAGGLMAAAVGSSLAQDPNASKTVRTAGTAAAVAGTGAMLASLVDAIETQKEREKFWNLTRAFYHQYYGGPSVEAEERPAPPPIPEVPFNFKDDEASDDDR
ncbi:MAG: hypothetical protein JO332_08835 [Planctomycetaceae bacterium]|nr:hypothetical protein [Planctomycetaceae bacterium]